MVDVTYLKRKMPFEPFTVNTIQFTPTIDGVYEDGSTTFADPDHNIRVRGLAKNKSGKHSGSVSSLLTIEVSPGDRTSRVASHVVLQISLTEDFTATHVTQQIDEISGFLSTSGYLDRFLKGES